MKKWFEMGVPAEKRAEMKKDWDKSMMGKLMKKSKKWAKNRRNKRKNRRSGKSGKN